MGSDSRQPLIGIVGPCGSGKTTLATGLEKEGYRCRHIAQEHSYVPQMWQVITNPDILIYLQSSFKNSTSRRELNWSEFDYREQLARLTHARQHANLVIDTDIQNANEVLRSVLDYLKSRL